jgi:Pyruvate/2-oxoacid:ferredoxin oxidoreductase gamma subunit
VRIGRAASGTIPAGEADVLLALEMNEALRAFPMMRLGSLALMHPYRRFPVSTGNSDMRYPTANEIEMISRAKGIKSVFVPKGLFSVGECMAGQDHYTIPANILMLGILCGCKELFARSLIEQALRENFPNHEEQNRQALGVGWRYGEELKACV